MANADAPTRELRAFRGTRRSSVYRDHRVDGEAATRIARAAAAHGLPRLADLPGPGSADLDKRAARQLAEEATRLRATADLPELDADLTAIAEVAGWCGRAAGRSWLHVG